MTKFYLYVSRYLAVLLVLVTSVAWSQSKTVTGTVTASDDGGSLPGVNVLEKGTSNGTITASDGTFSISVNEGATLVISFVGYKTQEIAVGAQSSVNVSLESDVTALSEVVVIGYGEVKKRDVTGAVASVKSEDFNTGVIASPELLIQGKVAGVQVTTSSGEPGGGVNIRIRGTSSVRAGNNPLFVVDGFPLSGEDVSPGGADLGRGGSASRNPLNFLNPNDIEGMDVLKDASATAIYGSRGANGVVIITTKNGKNTRNKLEYSTLFSTSRVANEFDLLTRDEFLTNLARLNGPTAAAEQDYGGNTDWQDAVTRTGVSQRHNLAFSDGYKGGSFRVSLGYEDQVGVIKNSGMERFTGRLNINHAFLNDKLKLSAQLTGARINDEAAPITNNAGFEGDLLGSAYMANPTWPRYADSQFSNTNANPLALLKYTQDNTETERFMANFQAGYDIMEGLNFTVRAGLDRATSLRENAYSPKLTLNNGVQDYGRAGFSDIDVDSDLMEAFFTYNKKFGAASSLNAILGYSYQEFNRAGANTVGWGFTNPNMNAMISDLHTAEGIIRGAISQSYQQFGYDDPDFFIATLTPTIGRIDLDNRPTTPVRSVIQDRFEATDELQSFFGRVQYGMQDNKYVVTATLRVDGSTKFGKNNKYGYFPSAAAAWRLSDETFIPEAFDDLKLRIGYGITGNQEIPHNLHQARQAHRRIGRSGGGGLAIENGGNALYTGIENITFQNDDLQWEETKQANIGLDFGFLGNRLTGSFDVYRKVTQKLLYKNFAAQPAPNEFGWKNLDADIVNKGIELYLNGVVVDTDNVGFNIAFNISYNHNKVENFDAAPINTGEVKGQGLTGAYAQRIADGYPLYTFFIREFLGFDANGLSIYNGDFQRYVGKSPLPKYNTGLALNFRYKNWDFNTFFAGQFGHYVYNSTANALFTIGSLGNSRNITQDALLVGEAKEDAPDASTRFLESGDFIRMQNFNIGYNFKFDDASVLKGLRVYFGGQNLFLVTSYSGLDPEVNISQPLNEIPSFGMDYSAYPKARTFSLGLNATF